MKRKPLTKVLSIILATLFVLEMLPLTVFAAELETYNHALELQPEITDVAESPISFEVVEEREENIKVYQREDGTFSAFTSAVPIHYEENGEWKDIDNTLIEKEVDNKTVLINKDNSYQVEFPEQITSDAEIKLDNGEAEIAFSMRDISASSAVVVDTPSASETSELAELVDISNKDSAVTFSNIRPNINVEYTVGAQTLKESIILAQKPVSSVTFEYELNTNGETAILNADSSITVYNDDEIAFVIESPYMFDSSDAISNNVDVSLDLLENGNYLITYTPDFTWLSDEDIVYPVTVDPTTRIYRKRYLNEGMYGTYTPASGSDSTKEWFIQNYNTNYSELCLDVVNKFFEENTIITSAKLSVYCVDAGDSTSNVNIISAREITSDWGSDTSALLTKSDNVLDYNIIPVGAAAQRYYWDVTEAASMWALGQSNCKGIALTPYSTDRCNVKVYKGENNYSTWMPWLEFDYKVVDTSRDMFEFSTVDMGRAGTIHFNQYTGTFYLVRTDLGLSGNRLPVTTGAVYDPWYRYSETTNYLGAYWNNINFLRISKDSQFTETVTNEDGTTSTVTRTTLKIVEPDLTVKIYTSTDDTDSSGKVRFEDKTGETSYTVYAASDVYSTKDYSSVTVSDGSITRHYDSIGRISKYTDENGNENPITYVASGSYIISNITDGAGRIYQYNGTYVDGRAKLGELEVLTSGNENITMGGTNVALAFSYTDTDVNNVALLTSITYPDGEQVKYEYNSDYLMTAVENIDGSRLEITYTNGRVSGYRKYVGDGLLSEGLDFHYESGNQRVLEYYRAGGNTAYNREIKRYNHDLEEISFIDKTGEFSATNYNADGEFISNAHTKESDVNNLIQNDQFTANLNSWNAAPVGCASRATNVPQGSKVLSTLPCCRIDSSINSTAKIYQNVTNLTVGDIYTFSAWGKANTSVGSEKTFGIIIEDANQNIISSYDFDKSLSQWQFGAASFIATTDSVTIYLVYDYQPGSAYFDSVNLFKSNTATVVDPEDTDFTLDSEEGTLTPETFVVDGITYRFSPCDHCSCAQCTTPTFVEYNNEQIEGYYNSFCGDENATCMCLGCRQKRGKSETKDAHGNVLTSTFTDGNSTMVNFYQYTADGNYLYSVFDSANQAAIYNYNPNNGLLDSYIIDPGADGPIQYTYNAVGALTQVSQLVSGLANGTTMTANYTYSDDRITSISHLGTTYNFEYDDYGNQTCVKVGEQPLVSYSYNSRKTDINSITYGNGFVVNYTLDKNGNITKIKYGGSETYVYEYSNDILVAVYDYMSMLKTVYADDGSTTIYPFTVTDSVVTLGDAVYSSATDDDGNSVETVLGTPYTYSSSNEEYIPQSDTVKSTESVSYGNNDKVEISSSVDFFGRTTNKTVTYYQNGTAKMPVEMTYGYNVSTSVALDGEIYQHTSNHIDSVLFNYGEDYYHYSYKYDTRGNITKIYEDDILIEEYKYDEADQLTEVHKVEADEAFVYSYDVNGNLISKTEYKNVTDKNISTGTVVSSDTYSYTDAAWSDKLTSFNGQTISYDLMGNPLSYRGATLTWNGRLLMSYEKGSEKFTYTYDADNLRTSKSKYVNNTLVSKETYIWSGDVLVATKKYDCATATSDVIRYLYDSNGESYGFTYNGNTYLYVKNLQGDVEYIISAEDNLLCVGYIYDPWGDVHAITDEEATAEELAIAEEIIAINNITYRGYFYDSETELYYLQSRYYNPQTGRFINADDTAILKDTEGIIKGTNLFSYCGNNSLNYSDHSGNWNIKNHKSLSNQWKMEKSFRENVIYFNQQCDLTFPSTDYITSPFHARDGMLLNNSVLMLFYYARYIYKSNKKIVFRYEQLFNYDGFTAQDKIENQRLKGFKITETERIKKLCNTKAARDANKKILDYINDSKYNAKTQAAMLLGFALHILQDYYAHQIMAKCSNVSSEFMTMVNLDFKINDKYEIPRCSIEDDKNLLKWRYELAKGITKSTVKLFYSNKVIKEMCIKYDKTQVRTDNYYYWDKGLKSLCIQSYYQEIYFRTN